MYSRILITGGPRTGKTTLGERLKEKLSVDGFKEPLTAGDQSVDGLHYRLRSTDALSSLPWGEQSEAAAEWFSVDGPWIVEGTSVARALRKWLYQHPAPQPRMNVVPVFRKPCDLLIIATKVHGELSKGQETMTKGVHSVLLGIKDELLERGVVVMSPEDFILSHIDLGAKIDVDP